MPDYLIYGGCLRSELAFPELPAAHGRTPDWTLRRGSLPHAEGAEVLADTGLSSSCRVQLIRGDGWFRYSHSCAGSFEVFAGGRRIIFDPSAKGNLDIARTDLIARVLLYCVERGTTTWLHGSAATVGGRAVAFLGASGTGKSTLALAMARSGGHHLCDDTLAVHAGPVPFITASDHTVRLCADSRARLASDARALCSEPGGKFVFSRRAIGAHTINGSTKESESASYPLAAIYLLAPREGDATAGIERSQLKPTFAIPALMRHLKLGPIVRPEDPARVLRQIGSTASSIPVFALCLRHDWSLVDDVVAMIRHWHAQVDSDAGPVAQAS